MNSNPNHNEKSQSHGSNPDLVVFSLGAILGAMVSLVLARSSQIRSAVQRLRERSRPDLESETTGNQTANLETAPPAGKPSPAGTEPPSASRAATPSGDHSLGGASKTSKTTVMAAAPAELIAATRWTAPTRYIMGVFLFLSVLVVIYIGRSAISLVIGAALLALFVDPLIGFLTRRFRMKRGLSIGVTYFIVVAVLVLVPLLAVPSLLKTFNFATTIDIKLIAERLSQALQSLLTSLKASPGLEAVLKPTFDSLSANMHNFATATQPVVPSEAMSTAELASGFGKALSYATMILGPTFSALASIFLTLLISLQMTLTAGELKNWYADLIPPRSSQEFNWLMQNIRQIWTGFLRGQMSLMLIIGLVTWIGGMIIGLPQALLLGIIAGVLELIPNIGPVLAAIPAVLFALLFGSTTLPVNNLVFTLLVIGFYVLVQLLENQFLVPRIMGEAVDLPPLIVLIGTIAGAGAFGILGALLATPFIATGNLLFRYVYRKVMEDYFVPPPVEEKAGFLDKVKGFLSRLRRPASH